MASVGAAASRRVVTLFLLGAGLLFAVATAMVAAGLVSNRLPFGDPPGFLPRLQIYLTRNVAETGPDPWFPELAPLALRGEAAALLEAIAAACRSLGWKAVRIDPSTRRVTAEIHSSLFGFRDDLEVILMEPREDVVEARVRSASRIGRGDLGANSRHVMDLRDRLRAAGLVREAPPA